MTEANQWKITSLKMGALKMWLRVSRTGPNKRNRRLGNRRDSNRSHAERTSDMV